MSTKTVIAPLPLSAYGKARSTVHGSPLSSEELRKTHAYWRACNYLALGMIYLQANPLLKEPLKPEHIKNRLLGHWGSSPGLAFIYIHLNRLIKKLGSRHDFHGWPWARCARGSRAGVSRGYLLRNISGKERGRSWSARVLQAVFLPRRHRQSLHAGNSRFDPRRRRTGIRAFACLRRCVRQSRPDRRRGGRATASPRPGRWRLPGTSASS